MADETDDPGFSIPTRQVADILFQTQDALAGNEAFTSDVRKVEGYAQITVLAISDKPFAITVEEAVFVDNEGNGHFVLTNTLNSSVVGSQSVVNQRISPTGNFMKMTVTAGGQAQSYLDFMARGLPVS